MRKLHKSYKNETGGDAFYYDEFGDNGKIYYETYVEWLENYIGELEARDAC